MNEYILYTAGGRTLAPNDDVEVENCQVLGCVRAKNAMEARSILLQENRWITEAGFSKEAIIVTQVLTIRR